MQDITVVDELMGRGKTTWIVNLVNVTDINQRVLVVVPYKEQYRRLNKETNGRLRMIDDDVFNKTITCKLLAESDTDLVITHSLFKSLPFEILHVLHEKQYKLILDETITVIEDLKIKSGDIAILKESNRIKVDDETMKVTWIGEEDEEDSYKSLKHACVHKNVYLYADTALIATLPINYFTGFSKVFICTYLFDYQLMSNYFQLYGVSYEKKSLIRHGNKKYLEDYDERSDNRTEIYNKLEINQNARHNSIGQRYHSLSKTNLGKAAVQKQLKKNFNTYYKGVNGKSDDVMWTTFKSAYGNVKGYGYTKGFVECNKKASNDFQNKSVLMYGCNRFVNPLIVGFLREYDIEINEEQYAVSELLQWIWRSRIRLGEPIKLYLPSKRMREALEKWSKYEL